MEYAFTIKNGFRFINNFKETPMKTFIQGTRSFAPKLVQINLIKVNMIDFLMLNLYQLENIQS